MIERLQGRTPVFAAALVASIAIASPVAAQQTAESIWSGGPILTMNDKAMRAEAVAVANGKILAVGKRSEVMKLKGPATQLVDLKGQTLVPGFVDAHGHVVIGGLQAISANLLAPPDGKVPDIASLQQTLRDWVQKNAAVVEKTKVIIGFGYDNAQLKELRHPTKEELDAVSQGRPRPHHPPVRASGDRQLRDAEGMGYDASTQGPGGRRHPAQTRHHRAQRHARGDRVLRRRAGGPRPRRPGRREDLRARRREAVGAFRLHHGRGRPGLAQVADVHEAGGCRRRLRERRQHLSRRAHRPRLHQGQPSSTYTNRFRVAGAKLTIDGSPQGFTAWRDQPYFKPVGNYPTGYSGYAAASAEDVMGAVQWAAETASRSSPTPMANVPRTC